MNLSEIRLPRELEGDGAAEAIRQALVARIVELLPGGGLSVPMITMGDHLKKVLQRAKLNGQILWGLEAISHKLVAEKRGLDNLQTKGDLPSGERVSRLLLMSNDGAQRFYRQIERLLQFHGPRILGCMIDIDGNVLGSLITGKERQIKVIMADHKGVVAEILRTFLASQ